MRFRWLSLIILLSICAGAQQTILNIPSADVLDKKQIYFRLDTSIFWSPETATTAPNFIFGLGHNIEAGINMNAFGIPADTANRSIVPNIKWKFYSTGKPDSANRLDLYAGNQVFFPTFHRTFTAGNYLYGAAAATVHSNLRFTVGGWDSANVIADGNRAGAMLGLEGTVAHVNNRNLITLAGDWQSGQGSNGTLALGIMFFPTDRLMLIPTVQFANSGNHDANGAIIFIGYMLRK